jgi:nucleobase:cation symporter-1, NCS1 family
MSTVAPERVEDDSRVPVREGEYGARVVAVEPGGIEYIPDAERHGRPRQLFWTWTSPNMEFATIFVGVLPIALFGGAFWPTVIGLVAGNALGCVTHGILTSWGPRFGVPQMVQSRGAFGFLGNLLPAGLNTVTAGVGWFAVNSVSGAFALQTFSGLVGWGNLGFTPALAIIVVLQVVVAFGGYNLVHQFEKVLFPYLVGVFVAATVYILAASHPGTGFDAHAPVAFGGASGAFILAIFVSYGYALGWNAFAADYSRYLPRNAGAWRTGVAAGMGVFISCVMLEIAGAALATVAGTAWGPNDIPTAQFIKPLPHTLAILSTLGIAIGAVAANALNVYSAAVSFLTLGIRMGLRRRRAVVAVAFGVVGFLVARSGEVGPGSKYEDFLLLIAYWITPWLAVVLVDYAMRRGRYDEAVFFDVHHNPWQGALAMAAGIGASVPFWNQSIYQGPIAFNHPELGDLSFVVGFAVAAVLYSVLARTSPRVRRS